MKNKVYIIGAGPGDPELITLKALNAVKNADVILYDRLISKNILKHRKKSCILKYVGKTKGRGEQSPDPQNDINNLLEKYAKKHKKVVRLKGGDPFLFGRGREEVGFLENRGIEYELVPGVSSFYSVPELVGIPLTHRELSSAFLVVTGHEAPGKLAGQIDWNHIASFNGTVVIMMGKSNLKAIITRLTSSGMDENTMCAVISNGSTREQKIVVSSANKIAKKAKTLSSPAIIVIGGVVKLGIKCGKEQRPDPTSAALAGKRFLLTASTKLNNDLQKQLESAGAKTDKLSMIKIIKNTNYSDLDRVIKNVKNFDWLVFTSRHGAVYFIERLQCLKGRKKDFEGKIVCVGASTRDEFIKVGITNIFVPEVFTTKDLGEALISKGVRNRNIAFLRTKLDKDPLKTMLNKAGARITDCIIYNIKDIKCSIELNGALGKHPDGILFLSPRSVKNFFVQLPKKQEDSVKKKTRFFSIGPVTTKILKGQGVNKIFTPRVHTVGGLIDLCLSETIVED